MELNKTFFRGETNKIIMKLINKKNILFSSNNNYGTKC